MESATFAGVQETPVAPQRLGQMPRRGGWRSWARCTLVAALSLAVTGGFAGAAYGARHSSRDLAFVLVTYYLLALLVCCAAKLDLLRRDGTAAGEVPRLRVRLAVWGVAVALATSVASRVADAVPGLALKVVVWGVAVVALALVFHMLFNRNGAECCRTEHGRGQADGSARARAVAGPGREGLAGGAHARASWQVQLCPYCRRRSKE